MTTTTKRTRSAKPAADDVDVTVFRVEVDGKTVWTDKFQGSYGDAGGAAHFGDYLNRAAETPVGEDHLSPAHLYVNDVLVGVQKSLGQEAEELHAESEAASDPDEQLKLRLAALYADAHAADARGDSDAATRARSDRARHMIEALTANPDLANNLSWS